MKKQNDNWLSSFAGYFLEIKIKGANALTLSDFKTDYANAISSHKNLSLLENYQYKEDKKYFKTKASFK